jgi:photoactive yellow protein
MKQSEPKSSARRTLPAPSEPIDVAAVIAERDRLRFELGSMHAEIARLRTELARLRDMRAPAPPRPNGGADAGVPLPRPSPLPSALGFADEEVDDPGPLYAPDAVPGGEARGFEPSQASGGIDFGAVSRLSPEELDTLPYGLICLDAHGRVVHYNDTEARMARLPKGKVVGRNFFTEVAPCTRVREFEGQFQELVRDPSRIRVRSFDFVFRFRHSEQHVTIVMTPARSRGLYNIALLRRAIVAT